MTTNLTLGLEGKTYPPDESSNIARVTADIVSSAAVECCRLVAQKGMF